jgi:hypothetical protein
MEDQREVSPALRGSVLIIFFPIRIISIIIILNLEFCLYHWHFNPFILMRISTTIPYYAVHCFCTTISNAVIAFM